MRLIDADILISSIDDMKKRSDNGEALLVTTDSITELINDQTDLNNFTFGQWELAARHRFLGGNDYRCTICNAIYWDGIAFNYCPACGSRMKNGCAEVDRNDD